MLLPWLRHQAQQFSLEQKSPNAPAPSSEQTLEQALLSYLSVDEPRSLSEILDHLKASGFILNYQSLLLFIDTLAELNKVRRDWEGHRTYYRAANNANTITK